MEACERLRVPGSVEGIRQAAERFDAFSAAHGLSKGETWPFQVALDETLSNIVGHGLAGRASPGAEIEIELRLLGREIEMLIVDDAPPFNPLEAAAPETTALSLEDRPVGGLGIALVRKLMEAVEYERSGGCNRLRLRRKLMEEV
ncbi:MAG TPA: ATP-binding protein [Vicinamibacteria bacterium]|nr:ATP-binding protein [Vicinamibacteria bacterium]